MFKANPDYLQLRGSYLFSNIAKKVAAYKNAHPDTPIIRLGIGDVTQPLSKSVIAALTKAVEEQAHAETFRGYTPDLGYDFLREAISRVDFAKRGVTISPDEIFISDGAKSDSGNIQEIFSRDCRVAVCDPVYPVYVDTNVMAGRAGTYDEKTGTWSNIIYMPCLAENGFAPQLPEEIPDIIYLCFPNNPTGAAITKEQLQIRSFSKNAGFTGVRLGYTVVPKELRDASGVSMRDLWARRHGTKFNGAPYIQQRAGEAVYTEEGQREIRGLVSYYMENARMIREGLTEAGFTCSGGVNSPYVWLKTPDGMTSWEFFDYLLEKGHVVGTPGSGFGPSGEGYFRLTAFGSHENTKAAIERFRHLN